MSKSKVKSIAKKKVAPVETPTPKAKKSVAPPAPKAEIVAAPKAETVVKEKAAPKEKAPSKFVSVGTFPTPAEGTKRLRVSEFQDYTFSINGNKDRRLTDEALAAEWREQFPHAVAFNAFHVKGARRDYNAGKHSKMYAGRKSGDDVSVEYGADKTPVTAAPKVKMAAK